MPIDPWATPPSPLPQIDPPAPEPSPAPPRPAPTRMESEHEAKEGFEFKNALLTIAGGVVAASSSFLVAGMTAATPPPNLRLLVGSVSLAGGCILLILILLADLRVTRAMRKLLRAGAVGLCVASLLPLFAFCWLFFAPRPAPEPIEEPSPFGVADATLPEKPPEADEHLRAIIRAHESSFDPTLHSEAERMPFTVKSTGLAPFCRRVCGPLIEGLKPGFSTTKLEKDLGTRLAAYLLPHVGDIEDLNSDDKYGRVLTEPWTMPELDDFYAFVNSTEARHGDWAQDDSARYLPVFHEWLSQVFVRFLLYAARDPVVHAKLLTRTEQAWQEEFDYWYFAYHLPPLPVVESTTPYESFNPYDFSGTGNGESPFETPAPADPPSGSGPGF